MYPDIPENTIAVITNRDLVESDIFEIIHDFRGDGKRDWFQNHAYWCLPLTIANQYGYGIRSMYDFEVEWNGGDRPNDVSINILSDNHPSQIIESHFGMGTITLQNEWVFQTPKGVNLMTINPPNSFIDGLINMNGVIETDNLKRDFTFNIRITRPNHKIRINKGDIISAILPIPRYYVDSFNVKSAKDVCSDGYIQHVRQCGKDFSEERQGPDKEKPGTNGRRYFMGEDIYGCPFLDHQKRIKKPKK